MKALKIILSIFVIGLIFGGCAYNWIVEEEAVDPTDPDAPEVSFSTQIVPIFSSKCVTCHSTGGQSPDLTTENAYSSLNSSRYVNTSDPASSLIYTKPMGNHAQVYSTAEAALVLTWITQGAQNN
ncbi:hypothetical protein [uncultured Draconibacterium sp.]|uniref:c-type cytochrome n=1 Tax=uncultured Draconibacterium sp. TaxID=1573823 RepID=UPI0029C95BCC|nr:hypothetical protein [uncultured Draconibacterium sp.]